MPTNNLKKYLAKLRGILVRHFDEEELRTLCTDLGADYDSLPGRGKAGKARELILYLVRRDELPELIELGKELRPRAHWDDSSKELSREQPEAIHFQNRDDDLSAILSSYVSSPYFLVEAPAGYGKSLLLERLAARFAEEGWMVAHVCCPEEGPLYPLATDLFQRLIPGQSPTGADAGRWGADLASSLKRNRLEELTLKGLVLLIDFGKKPTDDVLKGLLNHFIPAVRKTFSTLPPFSLQQDRFRVVLAGRYLAGRLEIASYTPQINVRRLTPFDYNVVRNTVRALFTDHSDADVTQITAHLMYLTGGHPGCLAHSIRMYQEAGYAPDDFLKYRSEDVWKDIVKPVVQDIRDHIPGEIRPIFNRLSVFRCLALPILDRLTGGVEPLIGGYTDGTALENVLVDDTHLLRRHGRLLKDDITRRLLAMWLREEEQDFQDWCHHAQSIYVDHLQKLDTQSPEIWVIEYLYQILQEHAGAIHDPEQRQAGRNRFVAKVDQILERLVDGREKTREQRALREALKEDWEFRFAVNYFLRDEAYSDAPYQQLRHQIDQFFSS